ncbi:MAG: protein kinase [Gemmatimonadales bacterium]
MDLRAQLQATLGDAYVIGRELGGGGMSRVFVADEVALQRQVVIKVLPPELAATVSIARFNREILLAARLQHPNIVPVLAAGAVDGLPYYTMPYIAGESLRQRIARDGAFPLADGLRILRDMTAALAHAHEQGIIHRDVKPGNVLLSGSSAMVTDFGVAKALWVSSGEGNRAVTLVGDAVGTPAYMSPEQLLSPESVDERADVYSLGVVSYELFVGRPPVRGRSAELSADGRPAAETLRGLRADLPETVADLVQRAIDMDPARRPQQVMDIIRALDDLMAPGRGTPPAGSDAPAARPARARASLRAAGVVAAAFILLGVGYMAVAGRGKGAAPAPAAMSIAVLPFVNEGGDPGDEYMGEGMADDLTSALGTIPGLHVVAKSSAFAFKGKSLSVRALGDSLHVALLLEGTVRRANKGWRVNCRLVEVSTERNVWSHLYNPNDPDVFKVQDTIVRAIAERLRLNLGAASRPLGYSNIEAHDDYLRAQYYVVRFTEPDLRKAMGFLQHAVTIDSTYAAAWAGIAGLWSLIADDWVAPSTASPRAREAALQALKFDSTLAIAHAVLGAELMWHGWDATAAAARLQRAEELDPGISETYIYRGALFLYRQFPDSALAQARRGQDIDPRSAPLAILACDAYQDRGDLAHAESECRRALEIDPLNGEAALELASLFGRSGRYSEAAEFAARGSSIRSRQAVLNAQLQISQGHPDSARKLLGLLEAEAQRSYVRPDPVGAAYLRLGDIEAGLRWYELAYREHSASLMGYGTGSARERAFAPPGRAVLADPRVQAFAAKVRLARHGV